MEITEGCLGQYDIAKVTFRPPFRPNGVMDVELLFLSKRSKGTFKGYMSITEYNKYNPRSYGIKDCILSDAAKVSLKTSMKQLAVQLLGELNDV